MRISDLATDTVMLYRGDASHVVHFEIGKTDQHALFGRGIYLTDSPVVAADYTLKTSEDIVFSAGRDAAFSSKEELVRAYLAQIAQELGFKEAVTRCKDKWQELFYQKRTEVYVSNRMATHDDVSAATDDIQKGFSAEKRKIAQQYVLKAKKVYAERVKTLKMVQKSTGEWVFVKPERDGVISTFAVPVEYCKKALDAETPLPDDLIPILRAAFYAAVPDNPNGMTNFRVYGPTGEDMHVGFDDYIAGFKTNGSFYAWANREIGGKGKNPSLDEILNGTHSGYYVWERTQDQMVADLLAKGYVGVRYQGGVRIAGNGPRGGGGILHTAYSFWDENMINSFRTDHHPRGEDQEPASASGMRTNKILGHF